MNKACRVKGIGSLLLMAGIFLSLAAGPFPAESDELCPLPLGKKGSGEEMLLGAMTRAQLYKQFPLWECAARDYAPNPSIMEQLRGKAARFDIIVFLGTWCKDSRRWVPQFLKVYDGLTGTNVSLALYGVDRDKNDGKGMAKKYRVKRVPTMIVLREGREVGRIVENPEKSMEADLLAIVEGAK